MNTMYVCFSNVSYQLACACVYVSACVTCPVIASPLAGRYLETNSKALTKIPLEVERPKGSTAKMSLRKAAKTPEESLPMPTSEEGLWFVRASACAVLGCSG